MDPNIEKPSPSVVHKENVELAGSSGAANSEALRKGLVWKLDLILLPLLALAYLAAYLDRNNIAYVALMGFEKDLKLSSEQYYNAVMVYFAGYLALTFPANLLVYRIGPNVQLGGCVLMFGTFVCCMCAARGYADVVGLRFGIGACEALLQATPIYGSYSYGRNEFGKRIAIFYSASTLSGVFSGLISYAVQKHLTLANGRPAWQWLYIIEGSFAILVGLLMVAFLPNFPNKVRRSWAFKDSETEYATQRSSAELDNERSIQFWQVRRSLLDPKTYFFAFLAGTNSTLLAATGSFLPSIVKSFGFEPVQAQLFTVIPYACAFVSLITIGILSDHYRNKGLFILGSLASVFLGLVILISTTSKSAGMVGATFVLIGAYPAAVLQIAWTAITFAGFTKRAVSWGLCMSFGQGLSMMASHIYTKPPRYTMGHAVLIAMTIWGAIMAVCAHFWMHRANLSRDAELKEYKERGVPHPGVEKSIEETCDEHITYRYIL